MNIREFTREEIPKAISKWLYKMVELDEEWDSDYLMERFYGANSIRDVLIDLANDINTGRWMRDLDNEI